MGSICSQKNDWQVAAARFDFDSVAIWEAFDIGIDSGGAVLKPRKFVM